MASVAASMGKVSTAALPAARQQVPVARFEGLKAVPVQRRYVAVAARPTSYPRLRISCGKADEKTVEKVKEVISKQLAMEVKDVHAHSNFADLGADSLDTVEIIMALEEQFAITLNQDGNDKILTVQDAADLIHDYIQKPKA